MRSLGMAILQRPQSCHEPSQDCLQVVQARIDNQLEHNCQGNNNTGSPGYRTLSHQCHSRQWPFRSALIKGPHAPQVPPQSQASSQSESAKAGQRRSLWHPPHEERVFRASTKGFARCGAPQLDWRRNYSLETNNTRPFTKWFRNQPPLRKLGTIPGTDARIGRSTIYTNWVWSMATRRRSPTKCVTATVGKPQLLDQVTAGAPHRDALQWFIKKSKGREETPTTEKPVTAVECTPTRFFYYMKVPIDLFSHKSTVCHIVHLIVCFLRFIFVLQARRVGNCSRAPRTPKKR